MVVCCCNWFSGHRKDQARPAYAAMGELFSQVRRQIHPAQQGSGCIPYAAKGELFSQVRRQILPISVDSWSRNFPWASSSPRCAHTFCWHNLPIQRVSGGRVQGLRASSSPRCALRSTLSSRVRGVWGSGSTGELFSQVRPQILPVQQN